MKRTLLIALLVVVGLPLWAQIHFFQGTYEEALQKAKEEQKDLFVDFWAEWCAPCKMLAKEVFTDSLVGEYFNARFVCVQLNVEEAGNKEIVKRFKPEALPTLAFVSGVGKELRRAAGFISPQGLLQEAKIALGEELSFEQLYEKYKKDRKDFDTQQQLLFEAPAFLASQEGYNREKWSVRIESLFPDYLKNKKLENMINDADFYILTLYHQQTSKNDPVFDFVVKNYDRFIQVVDTAVVARYLIRLNNGYIIRLCKQGNLDYKDRIAAMDKELQKVYAGFSFGSLKVQEAITLLADATYHLYKHDLPRFFENMDRYFAGKGDQVELSDYTNPLEELAIVYGANMPDLVYSRSIPWIARALEIKEGQSPEIRTRLLIILGQCLQHTGDDTKAKQSLNQAFIESSRIQDPVKMQQFQEMIRQMSNN